MLFLSFWLLGIVLIVLQTTLMQSLPLWLGRPDFLFILVTFIAYRFAWVPGIVLVFTLGWVMDVLVGLYLGFYPLMCLFTFAALKFLTNKSPIKESTYQIPLVGLSYFLVQIILYCVYSLALPEELPEWSWGITLQRTALQVAAAIPLILLCSSLYDFLLKHRLRTKPARRRPRKPM
ncbi:rod shape-determining protein MreD [Desulfopila sp. IMCC35006]|uniref:rod shape-determining protein MreD n=1 Tax=Desulfopila sp. IMCC35006 TaxID=2569542 RepID=UPI0010AC4E80|nr:rod shape-determining protein MreD [Desulfopila sp. IMCC35006]TKB23558.1 rod shape-determining protein MreD [Desulfopila sp. IMCC35006]